MEFRMGWMLMRDSFWRGEFNNLNMAGKLVLINKYYMFKFFKKYVDNSVEEEKNSFETMSSPKDDLIKIYNKAI